MDIITEKLVLGHPDVKDLVFPTLLFDINDIRPLPEITESYKAITSRIHLGPQFEWLARFCFHQNIEKIELGVELGGTNQINRELLAQFNMDTLELDGKKPDSDIYRVFRYFRFPLILTTKLEMKKIAKENGFLDLMNLTWFCHTPIKGRPCGRCNPCVGTIRDGLGYRIPWVGHIRYQRRMASEKIKNIFRKFPRFYRFLKRFKRNSN